MFLFPGPMPAGSRPSTLQDIAQGLGLSMGESGSEGPGTGRTSGHVDVCVCRCVCEVTHRDIHLLTQIHCGNSSSLMDTMQVP